MNKTASKRMYCSEIEKVENFNEALADNFVGWDLHHRLETELGKSQKELKEEGMYYGRPAEELIFLTKKEHKALHRGQKVSRKEYKRLTEEQKAEIIALREEGKTYEEIATKFNVTFQNVCRICNEDYRNKATEQTRQWRKMEKEAKAAAKKICNMDVPDFAKIALAATTEISM